MQALVMKGALCIAAVASLIVLAGRHWRSDRFWESVGAVVAVSSALVSVCLFLDAHPAIGLGVIVAVGSVAWASVEISRDNRSEAHGSAVAKVCLVGVVLGVLIVAGEWASAFSEVRLEGPGGLKAELKGTIKDARGEIERMKKASEFMMYAIRALGDDRRALDWLEKTGDDKKCQFSEVASSISLMAQVQVADSTIIRHEPEIPPGISLADLDISGFERLLFETAENSYEKAMLVAWLSKQNGMSRIDRLDFLAKLVRDTDSNLVFIHAAQTFVRIAGKDFQKALQKIDADDIPEWFEKNRGRFEPPKQAVGGND